MKYQQNEQAFQYGDSIIAKVDFATDLLIITFSDKGSFANRKLGIGGEALSWGFDAYPKTMKWAKPYESETIDEKTQSYIMDKIIEENSTSKTGFKIVINGGRENV